MNLMAEADGYGPTGEISHSPPVLKTGRATSDEKKSLRLMQKNKLTGKITTSLAIRQLIIVNKPQKILFGLLGWFTSSHVLVPF